MNGDKGHNGQHGELRLWRSRRVLVLLALALAGHSVSGADFFSLFKFKKSHKGNVSLAALSNYEMTQGVKEALGEAVNHSVTNLGCAGGFLAQDDVRIGLPDRLKRVEKNLQAQKQEALVDDFVLSLNQAAELVVSRAAPLLQAGVEQLAVDEPRELLMAPDRTMTRFFRKRTEDNLQKELLPIVEKSAEEVGVFERYSRMMKKADLSPSWFSLGRRQVDLNEYLVEETLERIFQRIGDHEQWVRQNYADSPSELLKKVFGAL